MEILAKEGHEKVVWISNSHVASKLILKSHRCKIFSPKYHKYTLKIENYKNIHWNTSWDCSKLKSVWKDALIKLLHLLLSWMKAGSPLLFDGFSKYVWNKGAEDLAKAVSRKGRSWWALVLQLNLSLSTLAMNLAAQTWFWSSNCRNLPAQGPQEQKGGSKNNKKEKCSLSCL